MLLLGLLGLFGAICTDVSGPAPAAKSPQAVWEVSLEAFSTP